MTTGSNHEGDEMLNLTSRFSASAATVAFWDALGEGTLVLPFCAQCDSFFYYPRRWCPTCWSDDVSWRASAGAGTIYAATETHVPFQGVSEADLPVTLLLVDLDEGVRVAGRGTPGSSGLDIGARVAIQFGADPATEVPTFGLAGVR
jgi:uncharacterized OB-fold protein